MDSIGRWCITRGCVSTSSNAHQLVHRLSCTFSYNGSILYLDTVDEEEAAVCEVLVEEEDDECDPRESGPV